VAFVKATHAPCPVPADFDQESYGRFARLAAGALNEHLWLSCGSGLNGVAFRFTAADEAHERFSAAIACRHAFHPAGPRYLQEESLFAFFFNACAAVECFYFAFYNLCAGLAPTAFATATSKDLRQINVSKTVRLVEEAFPGTPVAKVLAEVAQAPQMTNLIGHRNGLTHRGTSPRRHDLGNVAAGATVTLGDARSVTTISNPEAIPADWCSDLTLSSGLTATPRAWLGSAINLLIRSGGDFLHDQSRR
jgi:hypothetical protein